MNSINTEKDDQEHLDYQKYTNYIDPSLMTIEHYRRKGIFEGSMKYVNKIEQWLAKSTESEHNKPLVFQTESGIGKKSMLVQWLDHHNKVWASRRQRNLVLLHFASIGGSNTNYFYAIYRLLIRLREALKIKQKVQLLEQKIRKYFAYWLDVCNSELEKQLVVNDTVDVYDKIIIVIEGLQNFKDADTGKESNIAFWLPRTFPKNIKVIVTAEKSSQALKHLTKIGSEIVVLEPSPEILNFLLQRALTNSSVHNSERKAQLFTTLNQLLQKESCRKNIYTFTQSFISGLVIDPNNKDQETLRILKQAVESRLNIKDLESIASLDSLYAFLLGFWEETGIIGPKDRFRDLLIMLIISQKGLTFVQLASLTGIKQKQWRCVVAVFGVVIMSYKDLFMIHQACFMNAIFKKYGINEDKLCEYHERIADALNATPNSIRKLEEQTYHLYVSKSDFKLKEIISNIENFLLLFNPNNKYDLSRYWQKLEEKGFDPVIEYNKAIEGFSMHYHPSEENIFRIIVQISRFLKEFCDFETYYTPTFRHPPIEGSKPEMLRIGLLTELQKLNIYVDNSCAGADEEPAALPNLKDQIDEIKQSYFTKTRQPKKQPKNNTFITAQPPNSSSGRHTPSTPSTQIRQKSPAQQQHSRSKSPQQNQTTPNHNILSDIEQLNVDVPKNREKFRKFYLEMLKDLTEKKENQGGDQQLDGYLEKFQSRTDVDDDDKEDPVLCEEDPGLTNLLTNNSGNNSNNLNNNSLGNSTNYAKQKDPFLKKASSELKLSKIKENYNVNQVKPTLYYYKRWIWIQFPWACISLANNYSQTPELCLTSATQYMSVETEAKFTRQALKIAIEAKQRKKLMFTKKDMNSQNTDDSKGINELGVSNVNNTLMRIPTSKPGLFTVLRQSTGSQAMATTSSHGMLTVSRDLASPLKRIPSTSNMMLNAANSSTSKRKATPNNIDINLSALTKQLESKKAKLKGQQTGFGDTQMVRSATAKKLGRTIKDQSILEDQEQEQWSVEFVDKLKAFVPQNTYGGMAKNELLPKLKNDIKAHTEYELGFIKTHIENKKKLINQIIYENAKLIKVYRELKIKEIQLNTADSRFGAGTFEQLEEKKEKLRYEFSKSILQKQRLRIILKLCSENKTKNEEYLTSLNYLLQNLKKMIKWERGDMRTLQEELEELQQINEKAQTAERERARNEDLFNSQIKQSMAEKGELQRQINKMGSAILKQVNCQKSKFESDISGDRLKNEQKNKQLQIDKNAKLMEDQLDQMQNNYQRVSKLLEMTSGFEFTSSARYAKLLHEKQRNQDLRFVLFARKNKLEELQNTLNKLRVSEAVGNENGTSAEGFACSSQMQAKRKRQSGGSAHNNTISIGGTVYTHATPEQVKQFKTLKQNSLSMQIGFDNVALRLGLKSKDKTNLREAIVVELSNRLHKLRETSVEKFEALMDNKLQQNDLFMQEEHTNIIDEEEYPQ